MLTIIFQPILPKYGFDQYKFQKWQDSFNDYRTFDILEKNWDKSGKFPIITELK